jgi:hypothetical protein
MPNARTHPVGLHFNDRSEGSLARGDHTTSEAMGEWWQRSRPGTTDSMKNNIEAFIPAERRRRRIIGQTVIAAYQIIICNLCHTCLSRCFIAECLGHRF